jgi:pimeloyl-ACP methyl ester carboxylesterase
MWIYNVVLHAARGFSTIHPKKEVKTMPNATANGIKIEYDTFGDPSSPVLLLIRGLAHQMIGWDEKLCNMLADEGLYVLRFDNRDVGLSSKIDEAGAPDIGEIVAAFLQGEEIQPPYTLDDMADDSVGLLDALGIEKAHICGVSMGGYIAQIIAIRHPNRLLSLISMESGTGAPDLPQGTPEAMAALMEPTPAEREAFIEHDLKTFRIASGSKVALDEELTRKQAERAFDRCHYPEGGLRHLMAVLATGDRTEALKLVAVPTLVIHGSEDPLLPVEHGKATAAAIPGAKLPVIDGMGHGLNFPSVWPQWVSAISSLIREATQ